MRRPKRLLVMSVMMGLAAGLTGCSFYLASPKPDGCVGEGFSIALDSLATAAAVRGDSVPMTLVMGSSMGYGIYSLVKCINPTPEEARRERLRRDGRFQRRSGSARRVETVEGTFKRCDEGDGRACGVLGMVFEEGKRVLPDLSIALTLLKEGCVLRDANSCHNLAILHENGEGIPANPELANDYFEKACLLGDPHACSDFADNLSTGHGVKASQDRANGYYKIACDGGYASACRDKPQTAP